jgi:predicted helicase
MPSKHPRAGALLQSGVFDELQSFAQLEARISAFESTKDEGDAFEIFVEAYLATQPIMQASEIWLVGQVPLDVRTRMNLPSDPKGIDGIFRTFAGELVPYQVKFRSGGVSLTYTEVSPFLGLTERAKDRIIFTNAREVARDAKNRDFVRTVRAHDFNILSRDECSAIEQWLKQGRVQQPTRRPHSYQEAAISDIVSGLQRDDRATAVMACGTGKTLIALWVAERLGAKRIIVLVPSLFLVSQTLREWSSANAWTTNYSYICVCSDPTVGRLMDDIELEQIDTSFRITTDSAEIERFLDATDDRIQVVYSTYQSAQAVAKALVNRRGFDLAIFDEAHDRRFAGWEVCLCSLGQQSASQKTIVSHGHATPLQAE